MNISDLINEQMTDFRTQSPRTPLPAPFCNKIILWEEIRDLKQHEFDAVTAILKADEKLSNENRKHNRLLIEKVKKILIDIMGQFDIDATKANGDLYAPYKKILDEIETKNRMNYHGCYSFRVPVKYDDNTTLRDDSYDVYSWFRRIRSQVIPIESRRAAQREVLVECITYMVENGFSIPVVRDDKELTDYVLMLRKDDRILDEYPVGTQSPIVHDSHTCHIKHGQQFCNCGEYRVTYSCSDNLDWARYAWQRASLEIDKYSFKMHPTILQTDIIPF